MKNRYWIMLLAGILALCLGLIFLPSQGTPAELVQIKYGGQTTSVDLSADQELVFQAEDGSYNAVTVRDGKIAVSEANCPDQYCVNRGFCSGGTPIVCLPHGLVIEFLGKQEIDGLLG